MADELPGQAFRRCGGCAHAKAGPETKGDLNQRICFGAPPVPVALPHPTGIVIKSFHPPVAVNDPGCGMWKAKLLGATEAQGSA